MQLDIKQRGALVLIVVEDSPAANAGIRSSQNVLEGSRQDIGIGGDIIISIEGTGVKNPADLISYLVKNTQPEDRVTLRVLRENTVIPIEVILEPRPEM